MLRLCATPIRYGGAMIISDRLTCRMPIDAAYANNQDALNASADQLAREIIRMGEDVGAFIRRESVWCKTFPIDPVFMRFDMEALWSPDPSLGVELLGGPSDGLVVNTQRDTDGRPLTRLRLPIEGGMTWVEDIAPSSRNLVAEYDRAGIDSERDVWVYEYRDQS